MTQTFGAKHRPSAAHIEIALQHSDKAIQQGQRLQQVAQQLMEEGRLDADTGKAIAEHGAHIEEYGYQSKHWATVAQDSPPEAAHQAMEKATELHSEAAAEHIAATKKFAQVFQSYLKQVSE
ncbi:MAG: hypothetical protein VKK04_10370 [Synechococcales bacterium]|nr:hypothetical protein [Synechococcales bacterium]